jgi:hypothetical protein
MVAEIARSALNFISVELRVSSVFFVSNLLISLNHRPGAPGATDPPHPQPTTFSTAACGNPRSCATASCVTSPACRFSPLRR